MFTVKENTTLVGVSEIRTNFDKVLNAINSSKVLLERRNKPLAVIVSIKKYDEMEHFIELAEDMILGYLAKERDLRSNPSDYIDLDIAERRLKNRK